MSRGAGRPPARAQGTSARGDGEVTPPAPTDNEIWMCPGHRQGRPHRWGRRPLSGAGRGPPGGFSLSLESQLGGEEPSTQRHRRIRPTAACSLVRDQHTCAPSRRPCSVRTSPSTLGSARLPVAGSQWAFWLYHMLLVSLQWVGLLRRRRVEAARGDVLNVFPILGGRPGPPPQRSQWQVILQMFSVRLRKSPSIPRLLRVSVLNGGWSL